MLAAGAGRAEDVHLDVLLADVDLDGVVDVGIDEHRGERGVPPRLGIVRRDPDQPVDALLRLEVAVGVFALDLDRDRLDARLFPRQQVEHRDLEAVPLRPAHVHPHEHLGPVLRLGAAGAGMDREQRVPARRRAPAASPGARRPRRRCRGRRSRAPPRPAWRRRARLSSSCAISSVPVRRPWSSSHGVTHPLSVLISWTVDRALSGWTRTPPPTATPRASAAGPPWRSGQRKSRSSVTRCCSSVRRSTRSAMPATPTMSGAVKA